VTAGPLATPPVLPTRDGISIDPGSPFTFAQAVVFNPTERTATIEGAALSPGDRPLAVLGVYARSPRGIAIGPGTPPSGLHPLRGYRLRPGRAVAIVFHLRLSRAGVARTSGVRVRYEVAGRGYAFVLPQGLVACASATPYLGSC